MLRIKPYRGSLTTATVKRKDLAHSSLDFLRGKTDACLLIDGESLALMLTHYQREFISIAVQLPTVVACRCSPTQKADVARLIRSYTKKRVCCIGDGGNDPAMFKCAGLSIAMGQAEDAVKRQADVVTASNTEDGVALAIEQYILPH